MNYNEGVQTIVDGARGFHERPVKIYGQLAIRLDDDSYLMTKENIRLTGVQPSDIDLFDINSGDLGMFFRRMPGINAFAFICSEDSVNVSNSVGSLRPAFDDCAQHIGTEIPVVPDASDNTLVKVFKDHGGCLVKGAGIIAVANSLNKAIENALIIEKRCEAEVYGKLLGGVKPLAGNIAAELRKNYLSSYLSANDDPYVNYVGFDEAEFALRNELIETGKKMCKADLVQGRMGNLSVRLNDHEMLITPSGMNYFKIKIEDIVRVDINTLEYGNQRVPSIETKLHARMYRELPDCNAIIATHSFACSIFAACQAGFVIEDPQMQQLIGNLHIAEYAPSGTDELADNVLNALQGSHSAILSNHGSIFYGNGLELVLAIATAVEAKASNLLGIGKSKSDDEE